MNERSRRAILGSACAITVPTWSGIAGVDEAYDDVARTLGMQGRFPIRADIADDRPVPATATPTSSRPAASSWRCSAPPDRRM